MDSSNPPRTMPQPKICKFLQKTAKAFLYFSAKQLLSLLSLAKPPSPINTSYSAYIHFFL